jgi:hypothetical protein
MYVCMYVCMPSCLFFAAFWTGGRRRKQCLTSRPQNVGHFATIKTEGRTVENELRRIKHKKEEQSEKKLTTLVGDLHRDLSTWLDLPGVITPADIAHGFIETCKPRHHGKLNIHTIHIPDNGQEDLYSKTIVRRSVICNKTEVD